VTSRAREDHEEGHAVNDFPSITPTESALFHALIKQTAQEAAERAVEKLQGTHCVVQNNRISSLEGCVFGRSEHGVRGLDERMSNAEHSQKSLQDSIQKWEEDRRWLKRTVYAAVIVAVIGLAVGLLQFALIQGWGGSVSTPRIIKHDWAWARPLSARTEPVRYIAIHHSALKGAAPMPRTLKLTRPYMTGADVKYVQRYLADVGGCAPLTWRIYKGAIDGIFGPQTDKAVRSVKRWLGYGRVTGIADTEFVGYLTGKVPLSAGMKLRRAQRLAAAKRKRQGSAPKIVKHDWSWRYQPAPLQSPKGIVLHNTGAAKSSAKGIHAYHKSIGWAGIGYNFLVMKDGTIHEGRGEHLAGAHAMGVNSRTFGVAFEGNYDREKTMPAAQYEAGLRLIKWLEACHRGMYLVGHRQVPGNSTSCPGRYFPLAQFRRDA